MKTESVFKIAIADVKVREYLSARGWEFRGSDNETELDAYEEGKTGRVLYIEDISEDFPVTFLMGQLSLVEFRRIARDLAPGVKLLEVGSSWEGKPTTIVVAMSEAQVKKMFGSRTMMKPVGL